MLRWRLILGPASPLIIGAGWADVALPGVWLGVISLIAVALASGEVVELSRSAGMTPVAPLVHVGNFAIVACTGCRCCAGVRP